MARYKKEAPQSDGSLPEGHIVPWGDGYVFQCPCNERTIYVACPPHDAQFDTSGGLQTLGGSCGYRAHGDRPQNWCHFSIVDGEVQMHDDAKCSGRKT